VSVAAAIIGWIVIGGLAASPFAAVALLAVPRLRHWWLRPLQRRRARRRARAGGTPAPPCWNTSWTSSTRAPRHRNAPGHGDATAGPGT
jgi:hypothetical protein